MVTDPCLEVLCGQFADCNAPLWWLVDEHGAGCHPPASAGDWLAITNRCDVASQLESYGYSVSVGDFVLPTEPPPATVCYRVSKEKPLVHYLINRALAALPLGGELVLTGAKNEGLKTYADKAARLVSGGKSLKKQGKDVYLAVIVKNAEPSEWLPDSDYTELRVIDETLGLVSKPGVYGWNKIDKGSALLVSCIPQALQRSGQVPQRVADLGCGYGYLPVAAQADLGEAHWLLTDNNATALMACRRNIERHGIDADIALADCAEGLSGPVDMLLCNPPFHQGFAVEGELTERFLAAARRLLRPGGCALFVVNQFIPLPRKAEALFTDCQLLGEGQGFKVYCLSQPR